MAEDGIFESKNDTLQAGAPTQRDIHLSAAECPFRIDHYFVESEALAFVYRDRPCEP